MSDESQKVNIHGHDPHAVDQPGRDVRIVTSLGEKELICKFLYDPRGQQAYIPMDYYKHMIGPDQNKDGRLHPSLKSIGVADAPENDYYWECKDKLGALRKEGKGETAEGQKLDAICKLFATKAKGYFFFVEPESATIKAVKLGAQVINRLFGKKESQYRPAVPSLLKEMSQRGMSPYDLKSSEGWIKIWNCF